jgi:hypothetical protein
VPDRADGCLPDFSAWCYAQALAAGASGRGAELARMRLALAAKRRGDWVAAEDEWRLLAATAADERIRLEAIIELAKTAEHRRRNPAEALRWVGEAQRLVPGSARQAQLAQRARRLDRKAGVAR